METPSHDSNCRDDAFPMYTGNGVSLAPLEILWSPSAVLPKLPWKPGKRNSKPEFEA